LSRSAARDGRTAHRVAEWERIFRMAVQICTRPLIGIRHDLDKTAIRFREENEFKRSINAGGACMTFPLSGQVPAAE